MEDLFKLHYNNISCSNDVTTGVENYGIISNESSQLDHKLFVSVTESEIMSSDFIKAQITNHPLYPTLVSTYIDCRKVGASPETASVLEEISRESVLIGGGCGGGNCVIGVDSELDDFMESYCEILQGYKEELLKPLDEAATFVSDIQSQLSSLISQEAAPMTATTATATSLTSDEAAGTSEEEVSCKELEAAESHSGVSTGNPELKETLLRKYSGYLSGLKTDFLKRRKNGKLPKDARNAMLDWWNNHYRWPYPTEEEKAELSEIAGLDHKQIKNWFINQRKRHWRPSEDMRFALMEGVRDDNIGGSVYIDTAGATGTVDVSNAN